MNVSTQIRWGRVLLGGFLAEALLVAIAIPVAMKWGQHPLIYIAPVGSLVLCFLFALWVGRRVESRFVLHGALVGVVATAIYLALTLARPPPICLRHPDVAGGKVSGSATYRVHDP